MAFLGLFRIGALCSLLMAPSVLTSGFQERSSGGHITEQDFENGRKIDLETERPKGTNPLARAIDEYGGGNYEGDIMLNEEELAIMGGRKRSLEKRLLSFAGHWPRNGSVVNVPYTTDDWNTFSTSEKANIARAIEEYDNKTCIRFIERTTENDYIAILHNASLEGGDGCWSKLGKRGGRQPLSLETGCVYDVGTPIHEFMHALGWLHEQSRMDRDSYVQIHAENIKDGMASQFDKCPSGYCTVQDLAYDYGSVMHYSSTAFSKNGQATITKLDGSTDFSQRNGFSDLDIQGINKFYCGATTPCCDSIDVQTGLSIDGVYTKAGLSGGRAYYSKAIQGPKYLYWGVDRNYGSGASWVIGSTLQDTSVYLMNSECRHRIDTCPGICGNNWSSYVNGNFEIDASFNVTCAGCNDGQQNNNETDVDCGGSGCPDCVVAVDGNWGVWGVWGKCSKSCGKGLKSRKRQCNNPAPDGGQPCQGSSSESISCTLGACPVTDDCKNRKWWKFCDRKRQKCKKWWIKSNCAATCRSNGCCGDIRSWWCKKKTQGWKGKKRCRKNRAVKKYCRKSCKLC